MNNKNNNIMKTNKSTKSNNIMGKKVASFSISEDVLCRFRKHCTENDKNKSVIIEKMMIKYLDRGGKTDD